MFNSCQVLLRLPKVFHCSFDFLRAPVIARADRSTFHGTDSVRKSSGYLRGDRGAAFSQRFLDDSTPIGQTRRGCTHHRRGGKLVKLASVKISNGMGSEKASGSRYRIPRPNTKQRALGRRNNPRRRRGMTGRKYIKLWPSR